MLEFVNVVVGVDSIEHIEVNVGGSSSKVQVGLICSKVVKVVRV